MNSLSSFPALERLILARIAVDPSPQQAAAGAAMLMIFMCGLVVWTWVAVRWSRGEAALVPSPRRQVPWRWIEVVLVIGFTVGGAVIASWVPRESKNDAAAVQTDEGGDKADIPPDKHQQTPRDIAVAIAGLVTFSIVEIGVLLFFLTLVRRATRRDLGFVFVGPFDLLVGCAAALAAIVPVYALQILLVNVQDGREKHPLIEMLMEDRRIDLLLLAGVSAVIVAPLVEEFLFRVLLQGWLEKLFSPHAPLADESVADDSLVFTGQPLMIENGVLSVPMAEAQLVPGDELTNDGASAGTDALTAFASPTAELSIAASRPAVFGLPPVLPAIRAVAPITISSVLFAAAHAGTWPDPVPLFVLALILGYLYHQTHRIWPGVVVHLLFNATSLALVWFGTGG